jgi:arsenate reductase
MVANPILNNHPIVVTPLGVKLCRPSETVLEILPAPQRGALKRTARRWLTIKDGQRAGQTDESLGRVLSH